MLASSVEDVVSFRVRTMLSLSLAVCVSVSSVCLNSHEVHAAIWICTPAAGALGTGRTCLAHALRTDTCVVRLTCMHARNREQCKSPTPSCLDHACRMHLGHRHTSHGMPSPHAPHIHRSDVSACCNPPTTKALHMPSPNVHVRMCECACACLCACRMLP